MAKKLVRKGKFGRYGGKEGKREESKGKMEERGG